MKRNIAIALCTFLLIPASGCSGWERDNSARISFTGDIIMHIPVKSCALRNDSRDAATGKSINNGGFDYIFGRIRETLGASDLVVSNMEFPVSPPFESKPFVFNCRPEVLGAMKKAGITLVTIANNHITDQDHRGVLSTISYLKQYGIDYIGAGAGEAAARTGYVYAKNGIRVGLLACTGVINTAFPGPAAAIHINNFYKKEKIFEDIDNLMKRSDFRVMVIHYGDEYSTEPGPRETALIHEYMDRGVDLVIGHHPHVLQRMEVYRAPDGRDCVVFYSLGNFISNQSSEVMVGASREKLSTRDSVIVTAVLTKNGRGISRRMEIVPIRTVNEQGKNPGNWYRRSIQPVPIAVEIDGLGTALKSIDEKERNAAEKQLAYLRGKIAVIQRVLLQGKNYEDIEIRVGK